MNSQPIEKSTADVDVLNVHSIFPTIQGEGPFAGTPAIFVRLAGCNLQCPLCDTDYTSKRRTMLLDTVRHEVAQHQTNLVVITGGEPFRQAGLRPLVDDLLDAGLQVQIETNGTLYQELPWDRPGLTVVCSPKTGRVNPELETHIKAYKYVLHADQMGADGLPLTALDHTAHPILARPRTRAPIYLQPVDVQNESENRRHLQATVDSVMKHNYRLCLQQHKIIGLE